MLSSFRRLSKSKIGTIAMVVVLAGILVGFALADARNFGSGSLGFGGSGGALATVGDQRVTETELNAALQRRLQEVRQQQPDATYATIAPDIETILAEMLDQKTLIAFADANGFVVSKRLIDAEIAQIPQAKGLNGVFSDQAYQQFLAQRRISDGEVREIIKGGILQRLLLAPVAISAHVPVGVATPYASMMLEQREGDVLALPVEAFAKGLKPSDAQVQQFYNANRARYMVPEQRVLRLAVIGPGAVSGISASDKEIADYYSANAATYGAGATRSLTQVVVPDQKSAAAIAAKAKAGATLAAAAAPFGSNSAVTTLADQSRADYSSAAGDKLAAAVFSANQGAIVGPVQSDFGWVVAKVDSIKAGGGKSLAQARGEIATKLNADKRKAALEDLVDKAQKALDDGASFSEAAAAIKIQPTETPLIMADGASRTNASQRVAQGLMPAVKSGFEMAQGDEPEIASLGDAGYAMVVPASITAAAPQPLASIKPLVEAQWILTEAARKAKAVAEAIANRASGTTSLADAAKAAGTPLPGIRPIAARRMQIADEKGKVPPPLQVLFSQPQGKARIAADPQGRGFFVVKTNKVIPGNAMLQPALISRMQGELSDTTAEDYARQFLNALRSQMKAKRNEKAIADFRKRLLQSGN